jgi:hypothetical protein
MGLTGVGVAILGTILRQCLEDCLVCRFIIIVEHISYTHKTHTILPMFSFNVYALLRCMMVFFSNNVNFLLQFDTL